MIVELFSEDKKFRNGILLFEHGRVGTSVNHAHLHVLYPFSLTKFLRLLIIVNKLKSVGFFTFGLFNTNKIINTFKKTLHDEYVLLSFIFSIGGHKFLFIKTCSKVNLVSQYLRRVIAVIERKEYSQYDWKKYPRINKVKRMIHELRTKYYGRLHSGRFSLS